MTQLISAKEARELMTPPFNLDDINECIKYRAKKGYNWFAINNLSSDQEYELEKSGYKINRMNGYYEISW